MSYVADDDAVVADHLVSDPPMSFRAIIAGWLVATGMAGMLYVAGLAMGFSSSDAWNAAESAKGIGIGTAIWVIVTWVAALFLGGMFASWFDGHTDDTSGSLHGVTVWGLSVTVTAVWLALGLAHSMSGRPEMSRMGNGMSATRGMTTNVRGDGAVAVLDANIAFRLNGRDRSSADAVVTALIAGQDDTASALLAADMGTTQADAAGALQRLAPEIQAARRAAKAASDRTAHYLAMTMWIAFLSSFLALLAAMGGAGWAHHTFTVSIIFANTRRAKHDESVEGQQEGRSRSDRPSC